MLFVLLVVALAASATGQKPWFKLPFENVTLPTGHPYQVIECIAEDAGENGKHKWYGPDGEEITDDMTQDVYVTVEFSENSAIQFNELCSKSEGNYTCVVCNDHGNASAVFSLKVADPCGMKPYFDSPVENETVKSGAEHALECAAEGGGPYSYHWYNQVGDEITEDDDSQPVHVRDGNVSSSLRFRRVGSEHEGNYICTVSNGIGRASKAFILRVARPCDGNDTLGNGTSGIRDARVLKSTARSATFHIATCGPVHYIEARYSREGRRASNATTTRLHPAPGNTYEVGSLVPGGFYSFRFRTSEGDDWSEGYDVTLLPDAPEIVLHGINDRSVKVQWFTRTDDSLAIDKHRINYFPVQRVDGGWTQKNCSLSTEIPTCWGSTHTIRGLDPEIFYQIEVRAHTEAGYGEPARIKVHLASGTQS